MPRTRKRDQEHWSEQNEDGSARQGARRVSPEPPEVPPTAAKKSAGSKAAKKATAKKTAKKATSQ